MKTTRSLWLLGLFLSCNLVVSGQEAPDSEPGFDDLDWPQSFETSNGLEVAIHQPQVDQWTDYRNLLMRAALAVKPKGGTEDQITYGAMTVEAGTTVDKDKRLVFLGDRTIKSLAFPNAAEEATAEKYRQAVQSIMNPTRPLTISLDRVLANLERTEQQNKVVGISVEPPPIYFSSEPAILVIFLGPPQFEKIKDSSLFFAANTNWDLLLDASTSSYFLLAGETWLSTKDVMKGPWTSTTQLPPTISTLPESDDWADVRAAVPPKAGASPKVFVSDRPAELLLTDGEPSIQPIPGTKILYLANSESDVFMLEEVYYFLTAGRWFKASESTGPWESAMDAIPDEFLKIPEDHAKADILASVPGSPDAEEAIIMAQVPQMATVNRDEATLEVKYEGKPEFAAIKDTTVAYALNTPNDVFQVDASYYYCCEKGVWFQAMAPAGPWSVCSDVPKAIYTIPASNPKHNVTYVYVYESDPKTVTVGHTSGYSGGYVLGDLLVFGAGLWLASEILDDWDDHWHHYHWHYPPSHWSYGCGARYDWHRGGFYREGYRAYGPYGGAGYGAVYNPWTGGYARAGKVYGPRGAGFAREAYNPWTNTYGARVGASTPYGSWGRSVVRRDDQWVRSGYRSGARGSVKGVQTSEGAGGIKVDRRFGSDSFVGKSKNDNLYAGRDGNVYRRDGDGDWAKLDRGGWNGIERPATKPSIQPKPGGTRPAVRPTQRPSVKPTQRPSVKPTQRPSVKPTQRPSVKPTQRPSVKPTQRPSAQQQPARRQASSQLQRDHRARQRGSTRTARSRQQAPSRSSRPSRSRRR